MTEARTIRTVCQFWDWLDRNDDCEFWKLYEANRNSSNGDLVAEMDKHADWLIRSNDAAAHRSEVHFGA